MNCYTADCDDDDCTDKEDDKKEGGNDSDEGDGGGEGDSGNVEAEEAKLKVEAQMLDILSALLFSPRGGSNVKLWAGKLLARCVCLRLLSCDSSSVLSRSRSVSSASIALYAS